MPLELSGLSDALYWKSLEGFDFFRLCDPNLLVHGSHQALILRIMNDSVFGPFNDLYEVYNRLPQKFTGLTGYSLIENHIQTIPLNSAR